MPSGGSLSPCHSIRIEPKEDQKGTCLSNQPFNLINDPPFPITIIPDVILSSVDMAVVGLVDDDTVADARRAGRDRVYCLGDLLGPLENEAVNDGELGIFSGEDLQADCCWRLEGSLRVEVPPKTVLDIWR